MAIPESLAHIFDTEAQYHSFLSGELAGSPVESLVAGAGGIPDIGILPGYNPIPLVEQKVEVMPMAEYWYPDEPQGPELPPRVLEAGLPIIPLLTTAGTVTVGAIKWLIQQYGQSAVFQRIAQLVGVSAATAVISKVIASLNDNQKVTLRKRKRRYSIGANPRVGTLIKVAKFTDKLTRKMHNRFRHAGLIKMPRRHSYNPYHHRRRH